MPKTERIVIYCSKKTKKRWVELAIDLDMKYEELLNKLIDLYEAISSYMSEENIDSLINAFRKKVEIRYA